LIADLGLRNADFKRFYPRRATKFHEGKNRKDNGMPIGTDKSFSRQHPQDIKGNGGEWRQVKHLYHRKGAVNIRAKGIIGYEKIYSFIPLFSSA